VRGEGADMLLHLWNSLGMPKDVAAQYGAVTCFGVWVPSPTKPDVLTESACRVIKSHSMAWSATSFTSALATTTSCA
jgi:hypothetical protein